MNQSIVIAVMGPTASGKSEVAEKLAVSLKTTIINADAFQVYKGQNIGTNKPTNRNLYQGLDLLNPDIPFSLGTFLQFAEPIVKNNLAKNIPTIVCGGTGLYVRALFEGYKTKAANTDSRTEIQHLLKSFPLQEVLDKFGIHESPPENIIANSRHLSRWIERKLDGEKDPIAIPWIPVRLKLGLQLPRKTLLERIEKRLELMFQNGWVSEVQDLLNQGFEPNCPGFKAIGYRDIADLVSGRNSFEKTKESVLVQTRQYAKRQMTWLQKEPDLIWLNADRPIDEIVQDAMSHII